MNRPDAFKPEIAEAVARRFHAGEPLFRICQDEEMPGMHTVANWLRKHPDFLTKYHPDNVEKRKQEPHRPLIINRLR